MINEISLKKQNFIYRGKRLSNETFLAHINTNLIDLILSKIKYQNIDLIDETLRNTVLHVFLRKDGSEYQIQYFVNVHDLYSRLYKYKASVTVNSRNSVCLFNRLKSTPDAFEYNGDTYIELTVLRKVLIERILFLNIMSNPPMFQLINEYSMKLESRGESICQKINIPSAPSEQVINSRGAL